MVAWVSMQGLGGWGVGGGGVRVAGGVGFPLPFPAVLGLASSFKRQATAPATLPESACQAWTKLVEGDPS